MSLLEDVARRDGWRCWVCDEPVEADMSVNDARGPSVDSRTADRKAKVAEEGPRKAPRRLPKAPEGPGKHQEDHGKAPHAQFVREFSEADTEREAHSEAKRTASQRAADSKRPRRGQGALQNPQRESCDPRRRKRSPGLWVS